MKQIFTFCFFILLTGIGFTQQYNITFQLNTNTMTESFTIPEINGTFNNWCGACAPLSDDDGDGIYSITIPLPAGIIEYKFAADNWNVQETLLPGSSCTLTTGQFTNRVYTVSGDATLPIVCWGSCDDCGINNGPFNVTFRVDMNNVTESFTTPEVNGTFNDWCGGCAPMSDGDGDGIWEITIPLPAGSYEYKFAYDAWAGQETLSPGASCTITTDAFTNRVLEVSEATTLQTVCWGSCAPCTPTNISENLTSNVTVYPNPADEYIYINGISGEAKVEIIDSFGRIVMAIESLQSSNERLSIQELPVGSYIVRTTSNNFSTIHRINKSK